MIEDFILISDEFSLLMSNVYMAGMLIFHLVDILLWSKFDLAQEYSSSIQFQVQFVSF